MKWILLRFYVLPLAMWPGAAALVLSAGDDMEPLRPMGGTVPVVAVRYIPYPTAVRDAIARPHPDFGGWTDRKMALDLKLIHAAGIDVILLEIDPALLHKGARKERYMKFLNLAEVPKAGAFIQLVVDGSSTRPQTMKLFLDWCVSLGLDQRARYWKVLHLPVVELRRSNHIKDLRHEKLFIRHTDWARRDSRQKMKGFEKARISVDSEQVMILAGRYDEGDPRRKDSWDFPRRKGRYVRHALFAGFRVNPYRITVSSWNDYHEGSFIEPNTLDGDTVYDSFRVTLARIRAAQALPNEPKPSK